MPDDIFDPIDGSFARLQRSIAKNVRDPLHVLLIGGIMDELKQGVSQDFFGNRLEVQANGVSTQNGLVHIKVLK